MIAPSNSLISCRMVIYSEKSCENFMNKVYLRYAYF